MITNLKDSPELFEQTLVLIEESFKYQTPNSFKTDFYPLISTENRANNHIILNENNEVIAHVGCKIRTIQLANKSFTIAMLGGIAVAKDYRGSGLFQKLFSHVVSTYKEKVAFFLLWSDLEKLYNKFSFYLCGGQFELVSPKQGLATFTKTTFAEISNEEKEAIKKIYDESFKQTYLTLERAETDWNQISHISSADLFINRVNGKIESYFLMNKGQDLSGIIYEYGSSKIDSNFLKEISGHGKVWMGDNFLENTEAQYQFFLSIGDEELFKEFISHYTDGKFKIRAYNFPKNEIFVDFEEETLSFEIDDFLRGVFGPEKFEEVLTKPIFISGLDSI